MYELVFLVFTPAGAEVTKRFMHFQSHLGCRLAVREIERTIEPTRYNTVVAACRQRWTDHINFAVDLKKDDVPRRTELLQHPVFRFPQTRSTTGGTITPRKSNELAEPFSLDAVR
jgi:hypothetical protein